MRGRGQSLYLLGSEPASRARPPRACSAGTRACTSPAPTTATSTLGSPHDERVIEDINERQPDIVLVGMGTPKQELWVERNADQLDADVLWTVGALFDYVSGRVPRAPAWLADNGLEWIFRLAVEPQRMWRRYLLGNPVFISRVMSQARTRRAAGPDARRGRTSRRRPGWQRLASRAAALAAAGAAHLART